MIPRSWSLKAELAELARSSKSLCVISPEPVAYNHNTFVQNAGE